jgi:hypothetical protein
MLLVVALKNLISLTFLAASTALLTRISSTRRWWTRVTSSIEVDSDCCIIQSDIIRYYTTQSAQVPIIQKSKQEAKQKKVASRPAESWMAIPYLYYLENWLALSGPMRAHVAGSPAVDGSHSRCV